MREPVLYLIMRNDLPSLNPGKLAAQAAHCANAFVASKQWSKSPLLKQWQNQSKQGFGTTIVLGATRGFILKNINKSCHVYDDTYPCEIPVEIAMFMIESNSIQYGPEVGITWSADRAIFLRRELVGAFDFGGEQPEYLKSLSLYP